MNITDVKYLFVSRQYYYSQYVVQQLRIDDDGYGDDCDQFLKLYNLYEQASEIEYENNKP